MAEQRPNPDNLLQRANEEELQAKGGRLKIYLGAAPGVGKTYMMLQDALAKRAQGLDVVVGVVESHGRQEIETFLQKFEILPPQQLEYRGKKLLEFDLDAALKRNPGLILMDEMAHTNAPELRHTKRWQDIKELLDREINVYTTLNVQHIESLNDVVSQIIHTRIKETVPDFMLELADTIELIDLPPEDLIKRLQEGKVYIPQQAELAIENFFRKGNLIALRELALRVTAERVGAQVLLYRQGQGIKHIWPTQEKILVCVGRRVETAKQIRAARRMATTLQARWVAVHVDTPRMQLSEEQRNAAIQNLRLAEQLGAETAILTGFNAVTEIMNFAREQNITKMIVGKPIRSRVRDIVFGSFADELIRQSGEIDVYVISGNPPAAGTPEKPKAGQRIIPWRIYGISLVITAIATAVDFLLYPYFHESNLIMVYLLGITLVSLFGQIGPAIVASILSVLCYGFFFIPPSFTFLFTNVQYIFTSLVMLLVAQVISHLTIITRRQAESAHQAEMRTATLHLLSQQLASTRGVDKLLETAVQYISDIFNSGVLALLSEDGHLEIKAGYKIELLLSPKERGVAQWVADLGQVAGLGTDTLPSSNALYVPLLTAQGTIGVLRVQPMQLKKLFTPEQRHLLEACANQIALAIEVDRLQEQAKISELQSATDQVRNTLMTYLEAEDISLHKELCSIAEQVHNTVKSLHKLLEKKQVILNCSADVPPISFDKILINEVLKNLIDNALKFTPADSIIHISVSVEKNALVVSVEDNGPGIVPDEMNKLFEKFYRGKMLTPQSGLGLGLAICHRIIHAHGGKIWAENRDQGGAAFRFSLPFG